jgi:4-amino-4-deoxy-L-arabinose transferase-like glycosyltransferase
VPIPSAAALAHAPATERLDRRALGILAGLVVLGFVLRLAFGLGYWVGKPLTQDEDEYLILGTRVATGQGFGYPPASDGDARHFERPPVFALFLAGILKATHDPLVASDINIRPALPSSSSDVPVAIKLTQSAVGALAILLVAALAFRAGGPRAALAGGAIAAVYPPSVWMCGYVLSEPLYSALALATAWCLQRAGDATGRRQLGSGLAAGVLAGTALLTREAMLFFLPLAWLWLLLRRQYLLSAVFVCGAAITVGPWVARNYLVHHRFVLTAAHGGVTLWTGNNPFARGEGDLAANPDMATARIAFERQHPGVSNQELDGIYYREVLRFVRERPLGWMALNIRKLFYTFVPIGPSYRLHSQRYYLASVVSYGLLAPVALVGAWLLVRRRALERVWALGLLFASAVIVCLVFSPQERFRIPVIDPAAIVAAATCWADRRRA